MKSSVTQLVELAPALAAVLGADAVHDLLRTDPGAGQLAAELGAAGQGGFQGPLGLGRVDGVDHHHEHDQHQREQGDYGERHPRPQGADGDSHGLADST